MSSTKRKSQLMEELSGLDNLIRGSLVHSTRKCGKKSCACATGGPGAPYLPAVHLNGVRPQQNDLRQQGERGKGFGGHSGIQARPGDHRGTVH